MTVAALLTQGAVSMQARTDNAPEGNKTTAKALGVNRVSGRVTNEQGEALPGVVVRCGNQNVQTDLNGEFLVNATDGDRLTFTYIGYSTITLNADDDNMKVVMKENTQALGEVIVTTQKKKQSNLEIPVAVSAVTGYVMDKLNLHQMDDVAQFTPGVQVQLQSPNKTPAMSSVVSPLTMARLILNPVCRCSWTVSPLRAAVHPPSSSSTSNASK